MIIRCPWPPTQLRPNFKRSNHWSAYRPFTKAYREICCTEGWAQNLHRTYWPDGDIAMDIIFHPPKGCRWDRDNMFGAFKAGLDGLADAMKVNDKRFDPVNSVGTPVDGGCVVVRIVTPGSTKVEVVGAVE